MNFAITTTHAIPARTTSPYLVKKDHVLVCAWCNKTLGVYRTGMEREILEACHGCPAKLLELGPVTTIPFS